jgi:hypothetical protein
MRRGEAKIINMQVVMTPMLPHGTIGIVVLKRILWVKSKPMAMVYMICQAMYGSGVPIGMTAVFIAMLLLL